MRAVRIFLMLRSAEGQWTSTAHRDLDETIGLWDSFRAQPGGIGVMHVGLTRPAAGAFDDVAHNLADCLLLSTSARWTFHDLGTYSNQIGFVGDVGIHIALSGWGYEAAESAQPRAEPAPPQASGKEPEPNWILHIRESDPELARAIAAGGIFNDESYRSREEFLEWSTRRSIGIARMEFLMRDLDHEDPIDVLKGCPPWLLDAPMARVATTVRCGNALRFGDIEHVSDLASMTSNDLMRIPNLGRKSVRDLAESFWTAVKKGPIARKADRDVRSALDDDLPPAGGRGSEAPADWPAPHLTRSTEGASGTSPAEYFRRAFDACVDALLPNQAEVLRLRIGSGCQPLTLQEVADRQCVTRERIRQIEAKAILGIVADPVWDMELVPRLSALLSERQDPLLADSLSLFDPWFADAASLRPELRFVVERATGGRFYMLTINGCEVVTEIPKSVWEAAVSHAANIMEKCVLDRVEKSEVRRKIEDLLPFRGHELAGELWSIAQQGALFASESDGVERLVANGTSGEALVAATLANSPHPVHYTEMPGLIKAKFGRVIDVRRAHNAAGQVGILYGRGTYGTMRHCPLTADELALLREAAEAIVLGGAPERQWTCSEMLDLLDGETLDMGERVNQYVLQIALADSSVLANLGRLVWKAKVDGGDHAATRIALNQAILSLLESHGGPLTRDEIRDGLMRERGLSGYFQLNSRGSLIRLDARRWGLLERDVPLSTDQITRMRQFMVDFLFHKQSGVHASEVRTVHALEVGLMADALETQTILSILATDHRFKTSMSGYIYLSSWSGPRRLTQGEAIAEVMQNAGREGVRVAEVMARASALLGRQVGRESLYGAMVSAGAKFDDVTGTWLMSEEEEVM